MAAPFLIKVAVIDDPAKIREGLDSLISGSDGYACTGAYGSMEAALDSLDRAPPDGVRGKLLRVRDSA
jgi:DNA-binding NarL/FixJ family response regulator